jgi:thioredoxin-dependent peroxiredoxin
METDRSGELAVGDPAPDFRLPAGNGREIALSDYRGQAHVVLFFVRAYG